jgi:hypothetical protein
MLMARSLNQLAETMSQIISTAKVAAGEVHRGAPLKQPRSAFGRRAVG